MHVENIVKRDTVNTVNTYSIIQKVSLECSREIRKKFLIFVSKILKDYSHSVFYDVFLNITMQKMSNNISTFFNSK